MAQLSSFVVALSHALTALTVRQFFDRFPALLVVRIEKFAMLTRCVIDALSLSTLDFIFCTVSRKGERWGAFVNEAYFASRDDLEINGLLCNR